MLRKFRTIEDMNLYFEEHDREVDPERLARRLTDLFERSRQWAPGLPTGVRRFRTPEEANSWREQWVTERMLRIQTQRRAEASPAEVRSAGDDHAPAPDGP